MKLKSKLILMVTIPDILITWIIRFEVGKHFLERLLRTLNRRVVDLYITMYFNDVSSFEKRMLQVLSSSFVRWLLVSHRRVHREGNKKAESCRSCQIITKNKDFLQELVPDPKLYPPFKFSEK